MTPSENQLKKLMTSMKSGGKNQLYQVNFGQKSHDRVTKPIEKSDDPVVKLTEKSHDSVISHDTLRVPPDPVFRFIVGAP